MELNLKDIQDAHAQALFADGDTVTIQLYDKDRNDVTPALLADTICVQFGTTGIFQWPYANLDSFPTGYEEYTWTMTNQLSIKQIDVDSFASYPSSFLSIPFDVDLSTEAINKGDSFNPQFRVDTNVPELEVRIEYTDMTTYIYKATSNVADRGDGSAGGDDQVILAASDIDGAFKIYRAYLSGDETNTFSGRFVDMKITVTTPDNKTQTKKYKIGFSQTSAIGFDLVL